MRPDLAKDRFHVLLSRYHWVPMVTLAVALLVAGTWIGGLHAGIGLVLWGIFLRVTLGLHATWLVNSATHLWGKRRFNTRDDSRNSWWVALLTGGEGWHNNHHANPVSARHGLACMSSIRTTMAYGCWRSWYRQECADRQVRSAGGGPLRAGQQLMLHRD